MMFKSTRDLLFPLSFAAVFLLSWHSLVSSGLIPSYILPLPQEVFLALKENRSDIGIALFSTGKNSILGLGLAIVCGFSLGLILVSFRWLEKAVSPFTQLFQTIPVVALAPLLVIWFGFGDTTVQASAFFVSLFPILANTMTGLKTIDPGLTELFSFYESRALHRLIYLQAPSAFAHLITGLRVAVGLSVVGAIVGEFIAGGGIGSIIDAARTQQRLDLVFAAIAASSLLGICMVSVINWCVKVLLKYRPFVSLSRDQGAHL
ncbi:MAG: ABC transporter permease [Pseudobdellovibrionaceae bacterium]